MTRTAMINALSKLPFVVIEPGCWDDIGFTEREIWVNDKGYGYFMCDEIDFLWEGEGLGVEKWAEVREKIVNGTLQYEDIENTSLVDLISRRFGDDFFDQDDDAAEAESLSSVLNSLAVFEFPEDHFFARITDEAVEYYGSYEKATEAYKRDWADVCWEELPNELLAEWIDRLSIKEDTELIEWRQGVELESDFCDDEHAEIKMLSECRCSFTANNTKYFRFSALVPVLEGNKKRYVSLIAEGKDEVSENSSKQYVTRTVFNAVSTRDNCIAHFVVSGKKEKDGEIANAEAMGKWYPLYQTMNAELMKCVGGIVGKDPYAKSIELMKGLRDALETDELDEMIEHGIMKMKSNKER